METYELGKKIENIVGLKLVKVGRACEMLMFDFGQYAIHSQSLTRIIRNDDILVTTLDYQSWDGNTSENNDEWYNLDKYKAVIEGGTVLAVELNALNDLVIKLDNGITVQIIIQNSYAHYDEEQEQYRFFEILRDGAAENQEKKPKHYVVYNKRIEQQG